MKNKNRKNYGDEKIGETRIIARAKGLFDECTLTSKKPIISGTTSSGLAIYADQRDVMKGFRMFQNYWLKVFGDGEEVPNHGFCHRSKIIRLPFFDFGQFPEWMRLEKLKHLLLSEDEAIGEAVARVEKIIPERVLVGNSLSLLNMQI